MRCAQQGDFLSIEIGKRRVGEGWTLAPRKLKGQSLEQWGHQIQSIDTPVRGNYSLVVGSSRTA
jgi:hypothetical protein